MTEITPEVVEVVVEPAPVEVLVEPPPTVDIVLTPDPVDIVIAPEVVEVEITAGGPPGPQGPEGPPGSGTVELYDSDTPPVGPTFPYLRFERDIDGDVQSIYLGAVD